MTSHDGATSDGRATSDDEVTSHAKASSHASATADESVTSDEEATSHYRATAPDGATAPDEENSDGLATALELVGQRWALLVVGSLLDGAKRYGDLQRELGAPTNILATRLRELNAAGILFRVPLAHNVRAYALTERGAALRETIDALRQWGESGQH